MILCRCSNVKLFIEAGLTGPNSQINICENSSFTTLHGRTPMYNLIHYIHVAFVTKMSTRIKRQCFVLYVKNGSIENAMALQKYKGNMKHLLMKMTLFLGNVFFVILKIRHPNFHLATSLKLNFMICMVWIFLHNYSCCLHMNYDQSYLIFQLLIILI